MAFSYTSPANSDEDFVRSLIGDTDENNVAFKDQDITDHLADERLQGDGKRWLVASTLMMALHAKYMVLTKGVKSRELLEAKWTFGTPEGMKKLAVDYRAYGNRINSKRGIVFLVGRNRSRNVST